MASVVDICNRALSRIGASRITSITDAVKPAKACNSAYNLVRDEVLREHPWNCTITRQALAPLSTDPVYEYDNQYQLPSDCLRLLEVQNNDYDYVIEGRAILTDYGSTLNIKYQKREEDPQQYDSLLVSVIAARLAWEICEELTQSRTKTMDKRDEYKQILAAAKMVDAQEQSPSTFDEDDWITVRY